MKQKNYFVWEEFYEENEKSVFHCIGDNDAVWECRIFRYCGEKSKIKDWF